MNKRENGFDFFRMFRVNEFYDDDDPRRRHYFAQGEVQACKRRRDDPQGEAEDERFGLFQPEGVRGLSERDGS